MTTHVNHLDGPVIELGPGTGVFTRALLARGVPTHRLALIEADPVFASALALGTGVYGPNSTTLSVSAFGCDGRLIGSQQDVENAAGKGGISSAIDRAAAAVAAGLRKLLYG